MSASAQRRLICDSTAPAAARAWTRRGLTDAIPTHWTVSDLIDNALLIVSELVTNAIGSGCGEAGLSWHVDPDYVTVAVTDDAPGWPAMRNPAPTQPGGRGLRMVAQLASRNGVDAVDGGKRVWAKLAVSPGLRQLLVVASMSTDTTSRRRLGTAIVDASG